MIVSEILYTHRERVEESIRATNTTAARETR